MLSIVNISEQKFSQRFLCNVCRHWPVYITNWLVN